MKKPKPSQQVRTLVDLGKHLPKGSVGVVLRDDSALYPNDDGEQYVFTVIFPSLGNTFEEIPVDVPGVKVISTPHHNAVPMRASELEIIKENHLGG